MCRSCCRRTPSDQGRVRASVAWCRDPLDGGYGGRSVLVAAVWHWHVSGTSCGRTRDTLYALHTTRVFTHR